MTTRLPCIEMNPISPPVGSVIWLHGLGANGHDFVPIVEELRLPAALPLRFVFPHAPSLPVTLNNGYVMPAWYDIYSLTSETRADLAGIDLSVNKIHDLIAHESDLGIRTENILLAGFSQGAVIALTTALTYPSRLGGIIGLSGYLPDQNRVMQTASIANRSIPVFLGHGTEDTVVPLTLGEQVRDLLQTHHYPVEWQSYPMAHSVCADEIAAIARFMQKIFAPATI